MPATRHDPRRWAVLAIAIVLLCGSASMWAFGGGGSKEFAVAAMGRIGLVMAALWLAWPSLRRPASWLPPGMAVGGVILLAVLAANPRLVIVAVPAFGVLLAVASFARTMRR